MGIYDYKVKNVSGEEVSLSSYAGKVVLIINSATRCGFTPQYAELEKIYEKYADQGLEILDFPCNQFANQAPESNEEIASFCNVQFGIRFPIFSKIDVNGENAEPLFTYLKSQQKFKGFDKKHPLSSVLIGMLGKINKANEDDIKWNFTKFLVDRQGNVVSRFEPTDDMELVEEKIKELL
ncbi:glutathione peroxidase [Anaerobium acetethylicum]|uniref:Glutathione peroxidase n=1 Tax=Anaerobium acetethylicum TaxID=1619234 RepID=A0A1D3TUD8_9FIRM|nr:glutathione peroxidase [Anaerobium acetethylicum]SCP97649.1 glutathione peroxidase [Anaerobium acetethylicum]